MYAYKSVKWLRNIELIEQEHIGFWGRNGYDQHAWVPGQKPKNLSL
ncbi:MAG: sulfite oxidase-like oxidoreductase, partial [Paenibacillus sp.]|jgi:DMSO/TMAO reductase YedYZ molybdopterin-dependent catalytic subunit|nr:sulfite oxidase-like oxidoreductase [Paenibacillus sp.]